MEKFINLSVIIASNDSLLSKFKEIKENPAKRVDYLKYLVYKADISSGHDSLPFPNGKDIKSISKIHSRFFDVSENESLSLRGLRNKKLDKFQKALIEITIMMHPDLLGRLFQKNGDISKSKAMMINFKNDKDYKEFKRLSEKFEEFCYIYSIDESVLENKQEFISYINSDSNIKGMLGSSGVLSKTKELFEKTSKEDQRDRENSGDAHVQKIVRLDTEPHATQSAEKSNTSSKKPSDTYETLGLEEKIAAFRTTVKIFLGIINELSDAITKLRKKTQGADATLDQGRLKDNIKSVLTDLSGYNNAQIDGFIKTEYRDKGFKTLAEAVFRRLEKSAVLSSKPEGRQ
jgi:hypothetical protein